MLAWEHPEQSQEGDAQEVLFDLRFKDRLTLRTTRRTGGDIRAAIRASEGELRAADRALNGRLAGGRSAFRADRLTAVGAAIGSVRQLRVALRTLAGEIESAVGADFRIGGDFGAALGAGEDHNRQRGAAVDADVFVFQRKPMTLGAYDRVTRRARPSGRIKACLAIRALDQFRHDDGRADFTERRPGEMGLLGGQGVVAAGTLDRSGIDCALAVRARSGEQPIARGADRRRG